MEKFEIFLKGLTSLSLTLIALSFIVAICMLELNSKPEDRKKLLTTVQYKVVGGTFQWSIATFLLSLVAAAVYYFIIKPLTIC